MVARVIAPVHFTDEDLIDILNATRLRTVVTRTKGPGHDQLDILIPHGEGRSFRFERDAGGLTYLLHVSFDGLKLLASGSLTDCLRLLPIRPAL